MYIVAIDPGKTTGVFVFNTTPPGDQPYDRKECPPFEAVKYVDHTWRRSDNVHLVVERYTITATTAKMSRQYDALETIGALRYVAGIADWPITLQSRADKSRVSDATLRLIGWHSTKGAGHANDAARHAFVYLTKTIPTHDLVKRVLDRIDP